MPSYLVESYLPRSRRSELADTARRVQTAAEGAEVEYLRSTFLPADELCQHVLEAGSIEPVEELARRAGLVAARVVEAVPITHNETPGGAQ